MAHSKRRQLFEMPAQKPDFKTLSLYCLYHGCVSGAATHARMASMGSAFLSRPIALNEAPRVGGCRALVTRTFSVRVHRKCIRFEPQIWGAPG